MFIILNGCSDKVYKNAYEVEMQIYISTKINRANADRATVVIRYVLENMA